MTEERKTKKYNVNAIKMIDDAFEAAYSGEGDGPAMTKPDLSITVSASISMILIALMCFMTYMQKAEVIWAVVTSAAILLIFYFVYKYFKNLKRFNSTNKIGTKKQVMKQEFVEMFGEGITDSMNATEFLKKVTPVTSNMKVLRNPTLKDAVRNIINSANSRNNPSDLMCRNLTSYGKILSASRSRFYVKREDNGFVFYDTDFMNPKGEFYCDEKDVLSWGCFSAYPSSINEAGGKVKPDSIIIEISAESDKKIYFEINEKEYDKAKKLLKGIKEIKN